MARRLAAKKEEIFISAKLLGNVVQGLEFWRRDFNESNRNKAINDSLVKRSDGLENESTKCTLDWRRLMDI